MRKKRVLSFLLAAVMAALLCAPASASGETAERLAGKVVKIDCPAYDAACVVTYTYDYESMTMTVASENVRGSGGYFAADGIDTDMPFGDAAPCTGRFEADEMGRITYEQAANAVPMQALLVDSDLYLPAPALVYTTGYTDGQGVVTPVGCATVYGEDGTVTAQTFEVPEGDVTFRFDQDGMPVSAEGPGFTFGYARTPVYTDGDGAPLAVRLDGDGEASELHTGLAQYFDGGALTRASSMQMELSRQYWDDGALRHVTARVLEFYTMYPLVSWMCSYDQLGRPLFSELALLGEDGRRATQATTYFYGAPGETLEDVMAREGGPRDASGSSYVDMTRYQQPTYAALEEGDPALDSLTAQLDDCVAQYNRVCDGELSAAGDMLPYQAVASLAIDADVTVEQVREQLADELFEEPDALQKVRSYRVLRAQQEGPEVFSMAIPPDEAWELELEVEYDDGTAGALTVILMGYNGVWTASPQ